MLLATILSSVFMMEKRYASAYTPFVTQLIKGEVPTADMDLEKSNQLKHAPFCIDLQSNKRTTLDDAPAGSIAVIKVKGAIMKDDWCGIPGTETLSRMTTEAGNHPNVSAVMFDIDSGGGEADGTETFANTIKSVKKPTVAFVNTWACSAAYWVASGADEIIASEQGALTGSIGVMITMADYTEYYNELGIKIHNIYSNLSPDKNQEFHQALDGNYELMQKNILDPLAKVFHAAVNKNRTGKLDTAKEDVMTGKVYYSKDAKVAGLIDSIGNFESAVKRANQLTKELTINFS